MTSVQPAIPVVVPTEAVNTETTTQETKHQEKKALSQEEVDKRRHEIESYPIIDLKQFLDKDYEKSKEACSTIARLLHHYGFLIIRDPRVTEKENDTFIDMMEQYYEQPDELKAADIRKDVYYQVGVTPSRTERARDHCSKVKLLAEEEQPQTECPPELDNKLRFFWRMGERPPVTEFKQLNAEPVIPKAFPNWAETMNNWGTHMINACYTVAEMAAVGFDLPKDSFTSLMQYGPHLLGPTGSNLYKFNKPTTILASYHYDLNFLTIHGRSRFPGLFIWTRDGKKIPVKVPLGCLLLQAGKQAEWLTGGHILAGFHEVVVADETIAAIERAKTAGKSCWRVSSTLFSHCASDKVIVPLGKFATKETLAKYPPTKAGDYVQQELDAIKLGREEIAMGVVAAM